MTQPRITVITPSFNQGRFLERAICSVIDQEDRPYEYIVIDGDSCDQTSDILSIHRDDLTHLIVEPDSGPAEAINKALQLASGDIIAIVGADDVLLPGALHAVARCFAANEQLSWLVGGGLSIDEHDCWMGELTVEAPDSPASFLMHDSGYLPTSAMFFRRELFNQFGLFDELFSYSYVYEFACRLITEGVEPQVLAGQIIARRDHVGQLSAVFAVPKAVEMVKVAHRYAPRLSLTQRYALWVNCDLRRRILALAQAEGQPDHARRFLLQQIMRRPWWLAHQPVRQSLVNGPSHCSPAIPRRAA